MSAFVQGNFLQQEQPPAAAPPAPVEHFCDHPDCALRIDQHGRRAWGSFGVTLPGLGLRWFCLAHRESGPQVLQERAR